MSSIPIVYIQLNKGCIGDFNSTCLSKLKLSQGCYMTIHITPEPEFSYVSFESNVAASNYDDLISRVINLFQPGKFLVTIFVSKVS